MAEAVAAAKPEDDEQWKVPYWQRPVRPEELALHDDGPLRYAHKEGYLQKRAGTSRWRWNVRYFELKEGTIKWWRPAFKDQIMQPGVPRVALKEPRPKPVRCLDLTNVLSVTRTRVKFPYSTRILIKFKEDYTKYQLELRAEKELEIIEWFKILTRFTMEQYDVEIDRETEAPSDSATGADLGSATDTEKEQ